MSLRPVRHPGVLPFLTGFIGVLILCALVGAVLVLTRDTAPVATLPGNPSHSGERETLLRAILRQRWERLKALEEEANRLQFETIAILNARAQVERAALQDQERSQVTENPFLATPPVREAIRVAIRRMQQEYFERGVLAVAKAEAAGVAGLVAGTTPQQQEGVQDAYFEHLKEFEKWRLHLSQLSEDEVFEGMKRYAEDLEGRIARVLTESQYLEWRQKCGGTARGLYESMISLRYAVQFRAEQKAAKMPPKEPR